ncbi:DUF2442 domain-containing protein [Acetobacter pasteurianus]|uniref:DUF2442 domain-containing protein n=1 Tax=Acetobacter pasteurianus TaxID=438 RepID=UPI0009B6BC8D|nr:DUF2442 domain-containing protein [Acetobacter pasteurianus]GCD51123.1 hypothetical protein NBRC106471_2679 [Acetobacter pasteurianus subsp. pasteurianus LMG 1262 = NBRC 106471]
MQPPSFVLTPLWTYIQQSLELIDGRVIGVPLVWFSRLFHATPTQREAFELSDTGIHWDELDKDISTAGLLAGRGNATQARQAPA